MPGERFSILSSSTLRVRKNRCDDGPTVGGRTVSMPFNPQGNFPKVLSEEELAEKRAVANANMARREAEVAQAKREASLGYRLARRVKTLWLKLKRPFSNGSARNNNNNTTPSTGAVGTSDQSGQTSQDAQPIQSVRSMQAIHLVHSDQPGFDSYNPIGHGGYNDRRVQSYYDSQGLQGSHGGVQNLQGIQGIRSLQGCQGTQITQDSKGIQHSQVGQSVQDIKRDESKGFGHGLDSSTTIRPASIDGPTLVV